MRLRGLIRALLVVAGACAFGVVASLVKGDGPGLRDALGNLSAPWVIVPLLAGAATARGRTWLGAGAGLLATVAALAGFYTSNAFVLDLGSHSTLHDLALSLGAGSLFFRFGLLSGPLMGALGAWAARRGRRVLGLIACGLVALEPLAVYLFFKATRGSWAAGGGAWNSVYAAEAVVGLICAGLIWRLGAPRRATTRTSAWPY